MKKYVKKKYGCSVLVLTWKTSKFFFSCYKKKVGKLKISYFSWTHWIIEVSNKPSSQNLETWVLPERHRWDRLIRSRIQWGHKCVEILKWYFWWIAEGLVWTGLRVRISWWLQPYNSPHTFMGCAFMNPIRFPEKIKYLKYQWMRTLENEW